VLSRVAESLYWLSRNVERAETLARLLEVNVNRTIDRRASARDAAERIWRGVLHIAGSTSGPWLEDDPHLSAVEHCAFSTEDGTSILSCVRVARANALSVRAELSSEVWEAINGLYLFVDAQSPRSVARSGISSFLHSVRDNAQAIGGIVDATLTRDDEWSFLVLGRYLERASMTTRILISHDEADDSAPEWQRILEMCCASEPFAKEQRYSSDPSEVLAFLVLHQRFPRSTRFCVHAVNDALHRLSETPAQSYSNEAERLLGRMQALLDFVTVNEIVDEGITAFAGRLGERFDAVGAAIHAAYFPRIPVL